MYKSISRHFPTLTISSIQHFQPSKTLLSQPIDWAIGDTFKNSKTATINIDKNAFSFEKLSTFYPGITLLYGAIFEQ